MLENEYYITKKQLILSFIFVLALVWVIVQLKVANNQCEAKTLKYSSYYYSCSEKLNEIDGISSQNLVEGKANVLKQGDKILNLLDDYGRVLTDPSMTLKEIEPLVDRIEEEVSLFEVEAGKVGHDDTSLDRLTHDLATTAQVALFKFRRGDFL